MSPPPYWVMAQDMVCPRLSPFRKLPYIRIYAHPDAEARSQEVYLHSILEIE